MQHNLTSSQTYVHVPVSAPSVTTTCGSDADECIHSAFGYDCKQVVDSTFHKAECDQMSGLKDQWSRPEEKKLSASAVPKTSEITLLQDDRHPMVRVYTHTYAHHTPCICCPTHTYVHSRRSCLRCRCKP